MKYEFRCRDCGMFLLSNYPTGKAPEFAEEVCPKCNGVRPLQRWFSFGVPPGSSGEGFRKSYLGDNEEGGSDV